MARTWSEGLGSLTDCIALDGPAKANDVSKYLPLAEAADRIGVSRRTLLKWIADPTCDLCGYRPGGKWLLRLTELDRFIERSRVGSMDVDALAKEILVGDKGA